MDKPIKKEPAGLNLAELRKNSPTPAKLSLNAKLARLGFDHAPNLQAVIMLDVTGSMFKYFEAVKEKISEITDRVMKQTPRVEFSIVAYRNHGDETRHQAIYHASPFTKNIGELHRFLGQINKGGGGDDALTCLEDCFAVANKFNWSAAVAKSIVVIGDMPPHGVRDSLAVCPNRIDYRNEVEKFKKNDIKLFPVFCGHHENVRNFYRWLATETGGRFLELDEIDLLSDLLVAICMKSLGRLDEHIRSLSTTNANRLPEKTERLLKMLK